MALLGHHLDKLSKTSLSSASYAEEDKIPSDKVARKHLLQNDFPKYHLFSTLKSCVTIMWQDI